ncbi:MAG: hypothetical protein ACRES0_32905, partial [Pseudomonas sp.]
MIDSRQQHRAPASAWVQFHANLIEYQEHYMIACLRLFTALCLAALLAACASSPSSSLGELPRTP